MASFSQNIPKLVKLGLEKTKKISIVWVQKTRKFVGKKKKKKKKSGRKWKNNLKNQKKNPKFATTRTRKEVLGHFVKQKPTQALHASSSPQFLPPELSRFFCVFLVLPSSSSLSDFWLPAASASSSSFSSSSSSVAKSFSFFFVFSFWFLGFFFSF